MGCCVVLGWAFLVVWDSREMGTNYAWRRHRKQCVGLMLFIKKQNK